MHTNMHWQDSNAKQLKITSNATSTNYSETGTHLGDSLLVIAI